jgi:hypothetical protein
VSDVRQRARDRDPGRPSRRDRLGDACVAAAFALAATALAYPMLRLFERAMFREPNPAALVWSDRSPLVWRAITAAYAGGAAAFLGLALARRDATLAGRVLGVIVLAAVALVVVQAAVAP